MLQVHKTADAYGTLQRFVQSVPVVQSLIICMVDWSKETSEMATEFLRLHVIECFHMGSLEIHGRKKRVKLSL
jgi:hypothetical protein